MPTQSNEVLAEQEAYRSYFNAQVSQLMSRMWGGNLHMGLFVEQGEALATAQYRLKDHIVAALKLSPGDRVIEVACGVGTTAIHLARSAEVEVLATNISEHQLAEARARAGEAGINDRVTFDFGDFHLLPEPDKSCDAWICQEALLYARDRQQVFAEARRVVRPGRRLLFTDLTLSDDMPDDDREGLIRHVRAPFLWSVDTYDRFIAQMGFIVHERIESTQNAEWTFAAVLHNLQALESKFRPRLGDQMFEEARTRIERQYEAARAGYLGWCLYCLEATVGEVR
ncbi:SAM-dependent methyltransferase [Aestuariivirga sp.]|uniref:SAM-dependent methyltransferase n=1 Tax=Aestuariivirga sp. TaxID=2650926 RepID=UPI00391B0397